MSIPRTLRQGDHGYEVAWWRDAIGASRYPDSLAFDETLERRTREWQAANGLAADGVVGRESWALGLGLEILRGVDVSACQGRLSQEDWNAVAAAGCRFAYVRAVVGNDYADAFLAENVARARAAGIAVTIYFFPYPLARLDPAKQVDFWIAKSGDVFREHLDIPIVLDLEWPPPEEKDKATGQVVDAWAKWGVTGQSILEWTFAALARAQALTGHRWMVYTYRYFWRRIVATSTGSDAILAHRLALADYSLRGRVPTVAQAHSTAPLQTSKGIWEPTIVQHDGDGGLLLPNGRDADFNVLLGGESLLKRLEAEALGASSSSVAEPSLEDALAAVAASRQDMRGVIIEEEIAAYRRDRIDQAA